MSPQPLLPAPSADVNRSAWSRRRSIISCWGGPRRVLMWLAILFGVALANDAGWFRQLPTVNQTAIAADESQAEGEQTEGNAADAEQNASTEEDHEGGHHSPVTPVLLAIVLILVLAKTGGDLFERVGMPAVLGELVVGIVLGNFALLTGSSLVEPLFQLPSAQEVASGHHGHADTTKEHTKKQDETSSDTNGQPAAGADEQNTKAAGDASADAKHHGPYEVDEKTLDGIIENPAPAAILKILAGIGVVLLLFEVGLESTVREMLSVGVSSLLVAILGVAAPFGLGYLVGILLVPEAHFTTHLFLGATLCATSVGITARVLKDLGRSKQRESKIILGAAVIDDVLGLVILTVCTGIVASVSQGKQFNVIEIFKIIGFAFGFLAGAIVLGTMIFTRPLFKAASYLQGHGMLVAVSLVICFAFAWAASLVGLEPIVGAFAAGLILERAHYRELHAKEPHELEEALAPLTALLVPIFFVQTGTQVDLGSFANPSVWGLAAALTVVAVLGKQICSFGIVEKGLNKLAVGLGMIPRGEVGLIFAGVGSGLAIKSEQVIDGVTRKIETPVLTNDVFSAIVVMIMITTMVTPPLLKWSLTRHAQKEDASRTPTSPADSATESTSGEDENSPSS